VSDVGKLHNGRGAGIRFSVAARDFLFYIVSRLALGLAQPPVQSVPAAVSPGIRRQRREAEQYHLLPSLRMVKLYLHSPHTPSWRGT
jgi:hypothetical protein